MTTTLVVIQAIVLAISLTVLCGPEPLRRKLATRRYRSQLWERLLGLLGVVWVCLSVLSSEGSNRFGLSAGQTIALGYSRTGVVGIIIGLVLARLTLRRELGDQFKPAKTEAKT